MDWNPVEFGLRLRALREEVNYTMMAFGKEIGTSASRIKNWEEGKSVPSASWIVKISNRFGISVEDLLIGKKESSLFNHSNEKNNISEPEHHQNIEELVAKISNLKDEKYKGLEGIEKLIAEIEEQLTYLKHQDLFEMRTLIQLKINYSQLNQD